MSKPTPATGRPAPPTPSQTAHSLYGAYFEGLHSEDKISAAMADLAGAKVELAFMAPHLNYLLLQQLGRNEHALGILIGEVRRLNNFADRDNHIQVETAQSNEAIAEGIGSVLEVLEDILTAPEREPAAEPDDAPRFTRARAGVESPEGEGFEGETQGEVYMEDDNTTYIDVSSQAAGGPQ